MSDKLFIAPVAGVKVSDAYGHRGEVPGLGDLGFHTGDDYPAPEGTPILATANGVVSAEWWDAFVNGAGAGGYMIQLDHDNGYQTRYAHMREASALSVGDIVRQGDVIGYVGSTGAATGAHCHYEVLKFGEFVNPIFYMGSTQVIEAIELEELEMIFITKRVAGVSSWALIVGGTGVETGTEATSDYMGEVAGRNAVKVPSAMYNALARGVKMTTIS